MRPGTTKTVSETVTVENADGTTSEHTISATLSIPSKTVHKDVTLTILHPEHDQRLRWRSVSPVTRRKW